MPDSKTEIIASILSDGPFSLRCAGRAAGAIGADEPVS
jgi:hypothetical protein